MDNQFLLGTKSEKYKILKVKLKEKIKQNKS